MPQELFSYFVGHPFRNDDMKHVIACCVGLVKKGGRLPAAHACEYELALKVPEITPRELVRAPGVSSTSLE
jgi:hypothetical protein